MTKYTRQAIRESKFDYTTLAGVVSDIRKGFWSVERVNEFYKQKIRDTHSHFYQQIIPGRQEEQAELDRNLKKGGFIRALDLVDNPLQKLKNKKPKDIEVRFDSGSERDSYRPGDTHR